MFYTYVWLREDGTPYYIGKGSKNRAYSKHRRHGSAPPKGRIVFYVALDESEAFENEAALIWYYGRLDLGTGTLRNFSDGGEKPPNPKGKKYSKEHCKNISESRMGMVFTEEHIQNLITSHKGKPSPNKGRHPSDTVRLKMSLSRIGKKHSKETRRKMSGRIPWNYLGRSTEEKQAVKIAAGAKYRAKKKAEENAWHQHKT